MTKSKGNVNDMIQPIRLIRYEPSDVPLCDIRSQEDCFRNHQLEDIVKQRQNNRNFLHHLSNHQTVESYGDAAGNREAIAVFLLDSKRQNPGCQQQYSTEHRNNSSFVLSEEEGKYTHSITHPCPQFLKPPSMFDSLPSHPLYLVVPHITILTV